MCHFTERYTEDDFTISAEYNSFCDELTGVELTV